MPLFTSDGQQYKSTEELKSNIPEPQSPLKEETPQEDASFMEKTRAFMKTEDVGFNLFKAAIDSTNPFKNDEEDPNFNPIRTLIDERPDLTDFSSDFEDVKNRYQYEQVIRDLDFKQEQINILTSGSTLEAIGAGIVGSLADPLNLAFGAGIFVRAGKLLKNASTIKKMVDRSKAFKALAAPTTRGQAIARISAEGAALGTAVAGTREAILQSVQAGRTAEETAFNIAAEGTFGALLGPVTGLGYSTVGAAKHLYKKAMKGESPTIEISEDGLTAKVKDPDLREDIPSPRDDIDGVNHETPNENVKTPRPDDIHSEDINAARLRDEYEELSIARMNDKIIKAMTGPEGLRAPDLRNAMSDSLVNREFGEVLYNSNFLREKNLQGKATRENAQSKIFERDTHAANRLKEINAQYLKHLETDSKIRGLVGKKGKLKHSEFSEQVYEGLVDPNANILAEARAAAQIMREDFKALADEAVKKGLIDDASVLENYAPQLYNQDKILVNRDEFEDLLAKHYRKYHKSGAERDLSKLNEEELTALDQRVKEQAADTATKILQEHDQANALRELTGDLAKSKNGKFTKKREINFNVSELPELKKFLVTDANRLYKNYTNRMHRILEIEDAIKRAGGGKYSNFNDMLNGLRAQRDNELVNISSEAERLKVSKRFKKAEELLNDSYRSMLGVYKKRNKGDAIAESLQNYQFVRLLGGVTLTSLNEIFMTPLRLGLYDTLRDGWIPAVKSFSKAGKKLKREQLDDLVGAFEFEMDSAHRGLSGQDDIYDAGRQRNKLQKSLDFLTDVQASVTGINYWTQGTRRISANVTSASMIRKLKKWGKSGKMSKKDIEQFAASGISKSDYQRILDEIEVNTETHGNTFVSNIHLWKDKEAAAKFKNSVQVQLEGMTLNPGVESLPFFAQNNEFFKMMFQFKSFMNAATGKITLSTLQRRDAGAAAGIMMLISAGALQGMLKDTIAGRDIETDPSQLLLRGLSESGFLGLVGTTALDSYKTLNSEWAGRYGADNMASIFLGPSASQIKDISQDAIDLYQGRGDQVKAFKELLPFQNLIWYRTLLDEIFKQRKEKLKFERKLER